MLLAFHNDPKIKRKYLARVRAHRKADEIVKGQYWEEGKGCAVGCTIHSSNHNAYEVELGIPEWLARLEDTLFENLSDKKAKDWPVKFLSSIRVGAKLQNVKGQISIFILDLSLAEFDHKQFPDVANSIEQIKHLHSVNSTDRAAWSAAESAARSAAWSAARSAAWSAAWSAAESAAYAAESAAYAAYAAESAARSAARSAAYAAESAAESAASAAESAARSAARSAAYDKIATKLLELLKKA